MCKVKVIELNSYKSKSLKKNEKIICNFRNECVLFVENKCSGSKEEYELICKDLNLSNLSEIDYIFESSI